MSKSSASPLQTRIKGKKPTERVQLKLTVVQVQRVDRALGTLAPEHEYSDEEGWQIAGLLSTLMRMVDAKAFEKEAAPTLAGIFRRAEVWVKAHPRYRPYGGPLMDVPDVQRFNKDVRAWLKNGQDGDMVEPLANFIRVVRMRCFATDEAEQEAMKLEEVISTALKRASKDLQAAMSEALGAAGR